MTNELQVTDGQEIASISWDDIINSIDTEALSEKDAEALSYMLVGYSITESANMAGVSVSTWRRHIKENPVIRNALTEKKKLMLALMLNKFQKQMMKALDVSAEFLLEDPEDFELTKNQTSIYLKKVNHAEWVMSTFMKLMNSNPLEGLNINNDGDGDVNIVLNVDGTSALDYLAKGMGAGRPSLVREEPKPEFIANEPLLDERGLPPYGVFGSWSYAENGNIVCHVCGNSYGSKQAFIGHIGTHNVNTDMYAEVYNVIWDELQ